MTRIGAILLAGGRATRLGGAAKPLLEVGGRSLLQRAVDAAAACSPLTVVGEPVPGIDGVEWFREDPPFGGPAAAIVAALSAWSEDPDWTMILACDVPGVVEAAARLRRDLPLLPTDSDGVCLGDAGSRPQWLTGLYRTTPLRRAATALPDRGQGAPVRALLDDLAIAVVAAPAEETDDVDTWEDLERARARARGPEAERA
ncbi:molybdenum cofactor guanylyltransferase [uncultured Microbacterium sp.]|uniref:Molybdopterin-guanine dinucleotide biosynthesis protein A n=1 Tax=uncultured Microbacterium sp. TaxID=191216 RepID=A0A1Y5PCG7_9MICO